MSEQLDREDRAIEVALSRCLTEGDAHGPEEGTEVADEALVREYTELLGLLPYDLEPVAPNLSTKVRLLAVVGGDAGASGTMAARAESPAVGSPKAAPTPERSVEELTFQANALENLGASAPALDDVPMYERSPVDMTLRHAASTDSELSTDPQAVEPAAFPRPVEHPARDGQRDDAVDPERLEAMPPGLYGSAPPRTSWATWAMAAMLGFCMLGLGFLVGQSREQVATIARLQTELQNPVVVQDPDVADLQSDLDTVKRRLRMVTEVARSTYPMRTVSTQAGAQSPPDGTIYVCGQHQRWYLNVKGLEPPMPGKEYHLWFMTDDGTVDGGIIDVGPGALAEKDANSMPEGTRGFSITLEDVGEHEAPEGLMVLLGEQAVSL